MCISVRVFSKQVSACAVSAVLATLPWHEFDMEAVCIELKKPGGGLSLQGVSSPFDTILQAGLVVSPGSRHLTLDQLRNTLGNAVVVATTEVSVHADCTAFSAHCN